MADEDTKQGSGYYIHCHISLSKEFVRNIRDDSVDNVIDRELDNARYVLQKLVEKTRKEGQY